MATRAFQTPVAQGVAQVGVQRANTRVSKLTSASKKELPTCIGLSLARSPRVSRRRSAARVSRCAAVPVTAAIDPSHIDPIVTHLQAALPNLDAHSAKGVADLLYTISDAEAASQTAEAATKSGGFLAPVTNSLEWLLKVFDGALESAGVPYSYGFSIIALTLFVKVITYPLTKSQVESTTKMQALQPRIKELQAQYADQPEQLQAATAKLYQSTGVNPLAGCLPTLATLPVFIGLYRALTNVANEGLLTDGFFWIPSLAGPTSLAARDSGSGFSWLALQDGAPAIGWDDARAYLILPVILVISQYTSQALMQPPNQSEEQKQANGILKFLPLMIGWFSLNVPSGLTLYWFTNNVLTTAQQLYLRRNVADDMPEIDASAATVDIPASTPSAFTPPQQTEYPPMGDFSAPVDTAPQMSRSERRAAERDAKKGRKFAQRKAREAKKAAQADLPQDAPKAKQDEVPKA